MSKQNPTVKEIVMAYLLEHGFDGMYREEECACRLTDLFPCGEPGDDCEAGYAGPCPCDEGCEFHIGPAKGDDDE